MRIKEIETVTNHDVKAVEYFLKEKFEQHNWKILKNISIHSGSPARISITQQFLSC
jgi:adenylosuccinate lyase